MLTRDPDRAEAATRHHVGVRPRAISLPCSPKLGEDLVDEVETDKSFPADDAAGCRPSEMPGQKHAISVGVALDEVASGLRACLWADVGGGVPVGTRQLDRMMNCVTRDQGLAAVAPNPETGMTRAMSRQWRECRS